jgi:hypothetical protein
MNMIAPDDQALKKQRRHFGSSSGLPFGTLSGL